MHNRDVVMVFHPGLKIGQILKNKNIVYTFKCRNMGRMRRTKTTNNLVIVSDYKKSMKQL
jgi:5-methylcytosine-specific restriction enzyme A